MKFRTRLVIAFAAAALGPLVLLAAGVRRQATLRLESQHQRRVELLSDRVRREIEWQGDALAARLASVRSALEGDERFRLALLSGAGAREGSSARAYVLDYAQRVMPLSGLSVLQVQDERGRILSSGHFRHEFDRLDPELPRRLADTGGIALVRARAPDGPVLALARIEFAALGSRRLAVVGGVALPADVIDARDDSLGEGTSVALLGPDGSLLAGTARDGHDAFIASRFSVPYVDAWSAAAEPAPADSAIFIVTHSRDELNALLSDVNRWFALSTIAAVAAALLLALWLSRRISKPLMELAKATERIDLDRPEFHAAAHSDDEIGALGRRLGAMTRRLRTGAAQLREAERRATVGDVARQVAHDIRNGLVPLRNVVRHLTELAETSPQKLAGVFEERRSTIESSLEYLDELAGSYSRLVPAAARPGAVVLATADANETVRRIAVAMEVPGRVEVHTQCAGNLPMVAADPVLLRRVLENLVTNAVESLVDSCGLITLRTEHESGIVRIRVADTGRGMTAREMARAGSGFFTTKPHGTGLGLAVVRRLVADLHGSLRVESEPGRGTTFIISLPAAAARAVAESAPQLTAAVSAEAEAP